MNQPQPFTHSLCVCEDCARLRNVDRTALIARVAAERGVSVATGPRTPVSPAWLEKRAAEIRRGRLAAYEPTFMEDADGAGL